MPRARSSDLPETRILTVRRAAATASSCAGKRRHRRRAPPGKMEISGSDATLAHSSSQYFARLARRDVSSGARCTQPHAQSRVSSRAPRIRTACSASRYRQQPARSPRACAGRNQIANRLRELQTQRHSAARIEDNLASTPARSKNRDNVRGYVRRDPQAAQRLRAGIRTARRHRDLHVATPKAQRHHFRQPADAALSQHVAPNDAEIGDAIFDESRNVVVAHAITDRSAHSRRDEQNHCRASPESRRTPPVPDCSCRSPPRCTAMRSRAHGRAPSPARARADIPCTASRAKPRNAHHRRRARRPPPRSRDKSSPASKAAPPPSARTAPATRSASANPQAKRLPVFAHPASAAHQSNHASPSC